MRQGGLRQRMAWLHTWCGLVCAWLLCVIFLAGTLSVFRAPISHWMGAEPTLPRDVRDVGKPAVLATAGRLLDQEGAGARFWRIELPPAWDRALRLIWRDASGVTREAAMDPRSGERLPQPWGRKTEGGRHFMVLHYTLYGGDFGFWLVGWLSVGMLVALLSGVVVHKRIFKDFFTFRPGRGARAWLDGHNASAVLTLPFQLMIVYTGLAIFYTSYMPGPLRVLYGEQGMARWRAELAAAGPGADAGAAKVDAGLAPGVPARLQLGVFLDAAQAAMGGPARMVMVERPGQPNETIRVFGRVDEDAAVRRFTAQVGRAAFRAATGEMTELRRADAPPGADVAHGVMERLHLAAYGGWPLRWLYFLFGLAGTVMIATGAVLYAVKRRARHDGAFGAATPVFQRVVESLNVAGIAGSAVACIAYFHGNRLIPADWPARESWEIRAFFLVWLATLLHALVRPPSRAWREQFGMAALLCLSLPLVNGLTTGQSIHTYVRAGDVIAASVEGVVLLAGLLFLWLAGKVGGARWSPPLAGRTPPAPPGYRWRVLARVAVAVAGGYALAALVAIALAQWLASVGWVGRPVAVVAGTLCAFLFYGLAVMWVFAVRRAWLYLLVAVAVLAAWVWVAGA
ncbi:PepSY-associated TM helix domain-containing protein [Achromobacter dolens]|uniref:PepSY-associated TM helix domain-containing protein n=1 Tax=Achromobacter dolens TaxID=1287738 RepID=UPI0006C37316|nr:PepSY-associated TM helix domain-containing protein [Achromobacter dolens]CUJ13633.1 Uncharacterized iron-regulated membrane protein [Achromobacter dolens]